MGKLELNKVVEISRIQSGASGSSEILLVLTMKFVVRVRKIRLVIRSPSSHLANTRIECTSGQGSFVSVKNVENRTRPRKKNIYIYIFLAFIFFSKED